MSLEGMVDPFAWTGHTVAGKYRVDSVVAEGGFGVVYRAYHLGLDSRIALKCLKLPARLQGPDRDRFLEAFVAEGKLLHQLSRETVGIVQALDVGAATSPNGTWTPYLALEWLEGMSLEGDLAARAQRRTPGRSLTEAIALLEPAALSLGIAHQRGIVHRDIKPANLFLAEIGGRRLLKVVDFGIAKVMTDLTNLTGALQATGGSLQAFTPRYGCPEQFDRSRYGATGPWTDVFALALVLVEVLSGRPALEGSDTTQCFISSIHPERRPTPRHCGVHVLEAVEAVMARAVAVDPKSRYASAAAFWDALTSAAARASSREATDETAYGPSPPTVHTEPAPRPWGQTSTTSPQVGGAPAMVPPGPPATRRRGSGAATVAILGTVVVGAGAVAGVLALRGRDPARVHEPPPAIPASRSAAPVVERYSRAACGSIVDATTGLEWFVGSDRNTSWGEAWTWAPALVACDGGWRMPTVDELKTLYDPEHTAGTGYLRNGQHFPAKLHPLFADIGGGSWVWSNATHGDVHAIAYNFFTNGPVPIARDGSATGGLPHFTPRAFAVRGHAVAAPTDGALDAGPVVADDPRQRALPLEDTGFVDSRGGWEWSDRCFVHIKAKNWGWAKAECDEGMKIADSTAPQPRASLLFNEGLIARAAGDIEGARRYLAASVSLSDNADVRAMLASLPSR